MAFFGERLFNGEMRLVNHDDVRRLEWKIWILSKATYFLDMVTGTTPQRRSEIEATVETLKNQLFELFILWRYGEDVTGEYDFEDTPRGQVWRNYWAHWENPNLSRGRYPDPFFGYDPVDPEQLV